MPDSLIQGGFDVLWSRQSCQHCRVRLPCSKFLGCGGSDKMLICEKSGV